MLSYIRSFSSFLPGVKWWQTDKPTQEGFVQLLMSSSMQATLEVDRSVHWTYVPIICTFKQKLDKHNI